MELPAILELYARRREQRETRLREFYATDKPGFLVVQHPLENLLKVFGASNSIEEIYRNNIAYVEEKLQLDWTDDLPFLEPWIGTGVFANSFGCEYHFRDDNAPHVRYRYHKIEEVRDIEYPDYRKSPIMSMVLDCIDCFRERTGDGLPIALTDTQSPFDTATLVLDAAELFTACYAEPEIVKDFLQKITDLIVEFSEVQMQRIGPALLMQPGHLMPSIVGGPGISISDDNLAVSSPQINRRFALPMNEQLAMRFGGLAIHSCGVWTHTMSMLREFRNMTAIDCAVGHGRGDHDPNTNPPADVRQAIPGSTMIVKARFDSDIDKALAVLDELTSPEMRLIAHIGHDPEHAERNYRRVVEKLEQVYGQK
jgi:hypothetical protein